LRPGDAPPLHLRRDGGAEFAYQRASHSLRGHNEAACIDGIINVAVFDTAVDATVWRERKCPLLLNKFKAWIVALADIISFANINHRCIVNDVTIVVAAAPLTRNRIV
jgi:hypothetical protein